MRALIVEDEALLAQSIKKGLVEDGWAIDVAADGEEGLYLAENESYDAIILDIGLPKLDGLEVCRKIRSGGKATPILILTAKNTPEDATVGLDSGADDYLAKPFAFGELKARLRAIIRRSSKEKSVVLTINDLEMDTSNHTVKRSGKTINLTPKEFAILEMLLIHKNEVVTRTMITEHVWDYNFDSLSNVVDVFINNLRKKLGPKSVITVRGVGFKVGI